jgi:hypothetical protein
MAARPPAGTAQHQIRNTYLVLLHRYFNCPALANYIHASAQETKMVGCYCPLSKETMVLSL